MRSKHFLSLMSHLLTFSINKTQSVTLEKNNFFHPCFGGEGGVCSFIISSFVIFKQEIVHAAILFLFIDGNAPPPKKKVKERSVGLLLLAHKMGKVATENRQEFTRAETKQLSVILFLGGGIKSRI